MVVSGIFIIGKVVLGTILRVIPDKVQHVLGDSLALQTGRRPDPLFGIRCLQEQHMVLKMTRIAGRRRIPSTTPHINEILGVLADQTRRITIPFLLVDITLFLILDRHRRILTRAGTRSGNCVSPVNTGLRTNRFRHCSGLNIRIVLRCFLVRWLLLLLLLLLLRSRLPLLLPTLLVPLAIMLLLLLLLLLFLF